MTFTAARHDWILRGGTVLDGTGVEPVRADIAIRDDRIAAIAPPDALDDADAGQIVNVSGLRVAPGFIDIHTHSDVSATYAPDAASALSMGVTTQIVGNCGLALGFATADPVFNFEKRWLAPHGSRIAWESFDEHLRIIESDGYATNYVPLAGQGTLRKRVVGMDDRPATSDEMATMRRELEAAMKAGAWGLTSGLEYPPSSYADVAELAELSRVAAAYGGFYATHLRSEGDRLVEAVQEALDVCESAHIPLQLSHHKAEGQTNWGKTEITLGMVADYRARGLDVQFDQYPYTAFMTSLAIQTLPRAALNGTTEETTARLLDPASRADIRRSVLADHPDWQDDGPASFWANIQIGVCRPKPEIQGRTLLDLARESGRSPLDYTLELLAETGTLVAAVNFAMGETDIARVMQHPLTSIGSDGVATHPGGKTGEERIHPRAYGTFPRVLGRYVRELGILTEADAIRKMTALPATRIGLADRGVLRPGAFADITVYNPTTIADTATFDAPHRFAVGIEHVWVNGRLAYQPNAPTSARAGRVLRKNF